MTNQDKQNLKPRADKNDDKAPRTLDALKLELHSDSSTYVEDAIYQVGEAIAKIRDKHVWTNAQLLEYLDTAYFPNAGTISRLVNHTEKRFPNAAQLFDLRRVFGISLDALADGENPFAFEEMSDARLVELMEEISRELGRRIRQR